MKRTTRAVFGISAAAFLAVGAAGPALASNSDKSHKIHKTVSLSAELTELNGSGVHGEVKALVKDQTIKRIRVRAEGLTPDAPHAQHIHYGEQALNECPTLALDENGDGRLNTVEGIPAYGPVVVSLNTTGDTSPASFLDVTRFPVSEDGRLDYRREGIKFTDVAGTGYAGGGTAKEIAEAIRAGEGVVVIHGIDYNGNGVYDLSDEGASELDPSLPAEATDPAACGILH